MASIITGLRLSELSHLTLGSTGTRLYAVTQGGNSFQMTINAVFDTLSGLYLNDIYQYKSEDFKYVHKTGNESITGEKTFVNSVILGSFNTTELINTDMVSGVSNNYNFNFNNGLLRAGNSGTFINLADRRLFDSFGDVTLDWQNGILYSSLSAPNLDWFNKVLSGEWKAQGLTIQNRPVLTGLISSSLAPATPTSAGISGQLAISGQKLFVCTGNNKWGYINITPWV